MLVENKKLDILITGGNGYIAKSLSKSLKHNITITTRKDFDLADREQTLQYFANKYFDVVIHTAACGGSRLVQDDNEILDQNLSMYWNLVINRSHFNKFITFGSGAENSTPQTPYGLSKKVIASSMRSKPNFYNLKIFAVFDENELDTRFIKANIMRYLNKQPMEIHQDKYMDFFYMEDLVSLVNFCILNDGPKQIECTYTDSYKLSQVAGIINKLDKYSVDVKIHNEGLAKSYIGALPTVHIPYIGLETGIINTYNKLKIK